MKNPIKILIFILILCFYGSLLLHKIDLPVADDLPRHIKNGEMILSGHFEVLYSNVYSYTEPSYPFVNHHWLSGVVFYLVYEAFDWSGLVVFKTLTLLSAFIFLFLTALKKAPFWLVALFSIPAIFILAERTTVRPEIFSYFFTVLYLYILTIFEEKTESNVLFLLIPLQILWINLHIFFFIGFALVGGFLLERIIVKWKEIKTDLIVRKLLVTLFLLVVASVINPNGISGALAPAEIFTNYGAQITENQSLSDYQRITPASDDVSTTLFRPLTLLIVISFVFGFKKKPIFYFLATIATLGAGYLMVRTLPLFGLIFLPAISSNLSTFFYSIKNFLVSGVPNKVYLYKKIFAFIFGVTLTFLIVLGVTDTFSPYRKFGLGLTPRSLEAAEFFKQNNLKGPILNDFASGSYLIHTLYPQEKVFVDNRPEAYPASFFKEIYFPVTEDGNAWTRLFETYNFNTLFIYQYAKAPKIRTFLYKALRDADWSLVYAGTYHFIFIRNIPENQSVIEAFHITPENVDVKLLHLAQSEDYDDQVAVADIFYLIGREDLGKEMYLKIVAKWPEKRKVWMMLGVRELFSDNQLKNPSLAITYLEKAISLGQKTAEAYYYLAIGYRDTGQIEKAISTTRHSLKLNPDYQDSIELLNQIGY